MQEAINYINTVGFPIVACLGLGWFFYQNSKMEREENKTREERMFNQIAKFGESMDNFNQTLTGINQRLENIEKKVGVE